jgi:hypothetical protein
MNFIKENAKKHSSKIATLVITSIILLLILFAGPANAFVLNLGEFSNSNPLEKSIIYTRFAIEVNSNERMSLPNPIIVYMDDAELCSFSVDGTNSNCLEHGITINLISTTTNYGYGYGYGYGYDYGYGYNNYGYGYGYGYGYNQGYSNGILTYELRIDTSYFSTMSHTMKLLLDVGGNYIYESNEREFTITQHTTSGGKKVTTFPVINLDETPQNNIIDLTTDETEKETDENSHNDFASFITGAVTGINDFVNSGGALPSLIILVSGLIGVILLLEFRKRKLRK